jgi:cellulose biosynthesis protein BcsQ
MENTVYYITTDNQRAQRLKQRVNPSIKVHILPLSHVYSTATEAPEAVFCWDEDISLDTLREFTQRCPGIRSYILRDQPNIHFLRSATAAGAGDVWAWSEVGEKIQALFFIENQAPVKAEEPIDSPPGQVKELNGRVAALDRKVELKGIGISSLQEDIASFATLFGITSGKGGVGQTTMSVSFASALKKATGKRVALIDLSTSGDMVRYLCFERKPSLEDWVQYPVKLTEKLVYAGMHDHPEGEFYTLINNYKENIPMEWIQKVLINIRKYFDYVVIDIGKGWGATALEVLGLCNHILLVTTPSTLEFRNTKDYLFRLRESGVSTNKLNLILNRYSKQANLDQEAMERLLGQSILATLPEATELETCLLNQEIPMLSKSKGLAAYQRGIQSCIEPFIPSHVLVQGKGQNRKRKIL